LGKKIKNEDETQVEDENSLNTRQWCICMYDTTDDSIEHLISAWKSPYNLQVAEYRDTITIGDLKAVRITFKNKAKNASYRQLIYLEKYSTLFEIMNINEGTEKDFETFYKSIRIEEYKKTGR